MAAASGVFPLVLALAVGAPVVLWLLIESETDDTAVLDRREAEAAARADSSSDDDRVGRERPDGNGRDRDRF